MSTPMSKARPEEPCGVIIHYNSKSPVHLQTLKKKIEEGKVGDKIEAMKEVILRTMHGENLLQLLVPIIRFVAPSKDHMIKKLMLLYLEVVEKYDEKGMLYEQMILACNHLLKNLSYPNEFVKGSTLRFLCKLKDKEMLGHLIEAILQNLNDNHAYVRRNAILAVYSICKDLPEMIPDAIEMIFERLEKESDPSCKRNSLIMLFNLDRNAAIGYLDRILTEVHQMGEIMQLIVIEIIRKVVKYRPPNTRFYVKCIQNLLKSRSPAVQYEASQTLLSLTSAPVTVKAAANTLINLLIRESDQNVKMIVLEHIATLRKQYPKVLRKLVMDILRALSSPNMIIRKKTLEVALELVSPNNIHEIVSLLKKEIVKTQSSTFENREEYRQLLVQSIHQCAVKFSDVAAEVIYVLMDYIGDSSDASLKIILFVREAVQSYPELRKPIVSKLLRTLTTITSVDVLNKSLWIIAEYSESLEDARIAYDHIIEAIGERPPFGISKESSEQPQEEEVKPQISTKPVLLEDGSYATATSYSVKKPISSKSKKNRIIDVLLQGEFYLGAVLATSLCKLVLKIMDYEENAEVANRYQAEALLYLVSILRLSESLDMTIDQDSSDRINLCINLLINPDGYEKEIFSESSRFSLVKYLNDKKTKAAESDVGTKNISIDAPLKFKQLLNSKENVIDITEFDLNNVDELFSSKSSSKLRNITQLTGFSDPLYAEVLITANQFDIVLDITVINQTSDTLQNLSVELSTRGDLKLVDRPQTCSIGPHEKINVRTSVKVSSTETGVIFGCITYDIAGSLITEKSVVLNDISIDVIDYIAPAEISEDKFRKMWSDLRWEHVVTVKTDMRDLKEYAKQVVAVTNMSCLGSMDEADEVGFLTGNLYGRSIFGEDALANISIEQENGKIVGFVRIRADKEGVCNSLGEKLVKSLQN
eukprot:TRINITY_DN5608_c0_g1_i1.p1 TRINITY_DN5608_c0_g1~~TRINITY_DN5608_c0_g1_i1.p1  ORF type:complete len:931 (+),score=219.81 TRINITY_DN5608_c0_g1_i1:13-2805(+)